MKKSIICFILSLVLLTACKSADHQTNNVEENTLQGEKVLGDLYFGWLRIGNLYGQDISSKDDISYQLDTMQTAHRGEDSALIVLYKKLNEKQLLYAPYIDVKMNDGELTTWYLNSEDYEKIKKFKLQELNATNKKVRLTADLEKIYQNAYNCIKILEIELLDKGNYQNTDPKINAKDYE